MKGLCVYTMALRPKFHVSPRRSAALGAQHTVDTIVYGGVWQENLPRGGKSAPLPSREVAPNLRGRALKKYAAAARERGIDVWIWGYPWAGGEDRFVELMQRCQEQSGASGWLLDPELGYKAGNHHAQDHGHEEDIRERASYLLDKCAAAAPKLGLTSFGVTRFHKSLPWDIFLQDKRIAVHSPQLYNAAKGLMETGLEGWAEGALHHKPSVVPSIGTFGPMSGPRMVKYLKQYEGHDIDGIAAWSWEHTSKQEWKILRAWNTARKDLEAETPPTLPPPLGLSLETETCRTAPDPSTSTVNKSPSRKKRRRRSPKKAE